MMSGGSEWERTVRKRYFYEGTPEYDLAETGIPALLRVWAQENPEKMKDCAVQLGFEIWKRARKPLPKMSGMVARPEGMSDAEAARGIAAATNLAARIVAVSAGARSPSYALDNAISSVSWRISRFSRMRDDDALADSLDSCNEPVKRMMRLVEYERSRAFLQMTPYEGLRLALYRADFKEARRFAVTVLSMDPDDPEANFGTGMAYLVEEKLVKAEEYLKRTLVRRPDEPAVLNNLAIIYGKMKKFDLALEYARKAVKQVPENKEVKKTLAEIEELILKESNQ
jgi:tetratricopeptide (TPR) repeat protein